MSHVTLWPPRGVNTCSPLLGRDGCSCCFHFMKIMGKNVQSIKPEKNSFLDNDLNFIPFSRFDWLLPENDTKVTRSSLHDKHFQTHLSDTFTADSILATGARNKWQLRCQRRHILRCLPTWHPSKHGMRWFPRYFRLRRIRKCQISYTEDVIWEDSSICNVTDRVVVF